jgi:hypothetical protein
LSFFEDEDAGLASCAIADIVRSLERKPDQVDDNVDVPDRVADISDMDVLTVAGDATLAVILVLPAPNENDCCIGEKDVLPNENGAAA